MTVTTLTKEIISTMTQAIHFGVAARNPDLAEAKVRDAQGFTHFATMADHGERPLSLGPDQSIGILLDTGSYALWGEPDPTSGTFHIVAYTRGPLTPEAVQQLADDIQEYVVVEGRVMDYASVSDPQDWSEDKGVWLFGAMEGNKAIFVEGTL